VEAKATRSSLPARGVVASTAPIQLLHIDVAGPLRTSNFAGGERYFMAVVDDFSRYCIPFLMKHKSDVGANYRHLDRALQSKFASSIVSIRTDNEGQFTSHAFEEFLRAQGTSHQLSQPHHPQQNGVVERMNRTLMTTTRSLLLQAGVPHRFLGEALFTAAYLRNRTPSTSLNGSTPLALWDVNINASPNQLPLRVFGCLAWALDTSPTRGKLEPRAAPGVFLGYNWLRKSYRVLVDNQIVSSRDVRFDEAVFPFAAKAPSGPLRDPTHMGVGPAFDPSDVLAPSVGLDDGGAPPGGPIIPALDYDFDELDPDLFAPDRLQRSTRQPARFGYDEFAALAVVQPTPRNFADAMESEARESWQEAMEREMAALRDLKTWDLVVLPRGRRAIKGGWVFRIKHDANGNVASYKARYVARGYAQQPGVDFHETYAPVARIKTLRFILSLAAQLDLNLYQVDVASAYLHGELEEEIFMEQPEGFSKGRNLVCRLKKSLYGLKQAGAVWNKLLNSVLVASVGSSRTRVFTSVVTRGISSSSPSMLTTSSSQTTTNPSDSTSSPTSPSSGSCQRAPLSVCCSACASPRPKAECVSTRRCSALKPSLVSASLLLGRPRLPLWWDVTTPWSA
jgi:hypothetical protein